MLLRAKVVERVCEVERWGYMKFTGDESVKQKREAIAEFNMPLHRGGTVRILLLTSPSGGTGLTLTGANRVIILDESCCREEKLTKLTYLSTSLVERGSSSAVLSSGASYWTNKDMSFGSLLCCRYS